MEGKEWPHDPYKGLANYECEDEDLFAGRNAEIDACAQLLANGQTRLLILHGQTGCGKSSFLRAGLIPALERNGTGYIFLRRRSATDTTKWSPSFIRCGADPISRIAEEIFVFTAQSIKVPTATGPRKIDLTSARLGIDRLDGFVSACSDPYRLVQALERLSSALPHTLVLILDQAEEVITLNSANTDNRSRFSRFIKELTASDIDIRFVLAIRKDHSGQFIGSIQVDNEISVAFRTFFLSDLSRAGIREAILRPTLKSLPGDATKPAPFDQYKFEFAPELVDTILADLEALIPAGATLPVMQIVCRDLYEQVSQLPAPRLIELPLYKQGGIKGRVGRHLMKSLRAVLDADKSSSKQRAETELKWLRVLGQLVQEEGDGRVHTDVVPRKTLEKWAVDERIYSDVDPVLDGLTDTKVLILRKFAVLAPGGSSERELFCLGHDMIGIALGEALRDAEAKRSVSAAVNKRVRNVFWTCSAVVLLCLAALLFNVYRADSIRRQGIESLLARSASNHADNVLAALAFAKQAEVLSEQAPYIFAKDGRPSRALSHLLSGLPSIARAGKPVAGEHAMSLSENSKIYPTHPLPNRAGFAILRSDGVLEVSTVESDAVRQQTFLAPEPLTNVVNTKGVQVLSFSDPSPNLLLAMHLSLDSEVSGVVAAFSRSGEVKLFSYDDLTGVLGAENPPVPKMQFLGLSGDSMVFYSLIKGKSIHLKSVVVSDSLVLGGGMDRHIAAPPSPSIQVNGRRLIFFFYNNEKARTYEFGKGVPDVDRFEWYDLFKDDQGASWETTNFPLVKQCAEDRLRRCAVAAVQHLQQTDLIVLGRWESIRDWFGPFPRVILSSLEIFDLNAGKPIEVDLSDAASARQSCNLADVGGVAPASPAGAKAKLQDNDVPTFLVNGPNGLVLGYASRTSAQLINISSGRMTCREIFFPDVVIDRWTPGDGGRKLLAVSRTAGFVWDLQSMGKEANDDSISKRLKEICADQLTKFIGDEGVPSERTSEQKTYLDTICS